MLFTGTQVSFEDKLAGLNVETSQSVILVDTVVESAGGAIPQLSEALQAQQVPEEVADEIELAAGEAFTDGAKWAAFAAALFLLLGFGSTFNLSSRVRKE